MLIPAASALFSRNNPNVTASAQVVAANSERNGLNISNDAAGAVLYLLLGAGTASATNFDISLGVGGNWPGTIGGVVWQGAVQAFSVGSRVCVTEI